ncbi:Integrase [Desulfomicrobium apsheronum]|uniref:Integrase n=1 Tax=Desulfomicrobium apsheronum TaxID=52560 RepID=A0A1I3UQR4_9BACT|nr:integrase arm-type DNA-binding domain-containing protein [Desulfomicrobium apsheronum]SFJ85678.1 Integrase [Desulfomicrobium apsheronum]
MLTDAQIRAAKPSDKAYKLYDADGLFLFVPPSGSKLWRMKYRENGKEKLASFGKYPIVTLNEARLKKDEFKIALGRGELPPKAQRKDESLEKIAREWYSKKAPGWAESHAVKIMLGLEKNVFPFIGSRTMDSLEPPEILALLRRIEARGAVDLAHRTRGIIGQVFRYAIATGRATRNPAGDLVGAIPPARVQHYPALTDPAEVGALLRAIEAFTGTPHVRVALRLAPMLFVRPGELRKMEWSELDLSGREWCIPAEKMKTRNPHIVPLALQATELLGELPKVGQYVFPNGGKDKSKAMSEAAINAALRRLGYDTKSEITAHGFRAIARTLLHERLRIDPVIIEHQLAHAVPDTLGRAYNRTKFLDERRKMMQLWADYLDELKAGQGRKVLPFTVNE